MPDFDLNDPNALADDTGTFDAVSTIARVETYDGDAPMVYGLGTKKPEYEGQKRSSRSAVVMVLGGAVAAAALMGFLLVAQPFASDATDAGATQAAGGQASGEQGETDDASMQQEVAEAEPAPVANDAQVLSQQLIASMASGLSYAGTDLPTGSDPIEVAIANGRVMVTHTATDVAGVDAATLVGRAAQRAAALSYALGGNRVQGEGEDEPTGARDVTWVVNNTMNNAYLVVTYVAGQAPESGDGLDVLAASPSYAISGSLYQLIADPGDLAQAAGPAPTDLEGTSIFPTASL